MAEEEKIGKPWQDDELDAIIADYFFMLSLLHNSSNAANFPCVRGAEGPALRPARA